MMEMKIENPATCEVRPVIRFSEAKTIHPAEIYGQIVKAYDKGATDESNVRKWCRLFREGRTNVQGEERSARPSLFADDLNENMKAEIPENGLFTIYELHEDFYGRPESEK
jgi:hypothetical protein